MESSEFDEAYDDDDARQAEAERRLGERILNARISELSPPAAVMVPESATIREAIQVMLDRGVGAVLIGSAGHAAGIFTERDVLRRVALSGVDHGRPVSEVMTADPDVLDLDDDTVFALNRMIVGGYRHVPLKDDSGSTVAMLSVRDVVGFIDSLLPERVRNLPPESRLEARSPDGG
jgi:signal-transduction protein with cAMP-binding, CBS, and nucleotidyltransferase domain